jgi:hypothetical protein
LLAGVVHFGMKALQLQDGSDTAGSVNVVVDNENCISLL